jgi:hypothetical protein
MIENSAALAYLMPALKAPFDPADIDFLPKGAFEKNGQSMVVGMPFADKRVYEDRLNEVCPGEWSSQASITVAAAKIIAVVIVTIAGVPHADVGEANVGENSATEAYAQAFKRACSQVGLGRFLYSLDKQFLPYDKAKKRITLSENERKGLVRQMYKKAGLLNEPAPVQQARPEQHQESAPDPTGPVSDQQRRRISELCKQLGGKKVALPANHLAAEELIGQLTQELPSGADRVVARVQNAPTAARVQENW